MYSGDFESKKTRGAKIVPLPPNWSTPLTTQRCSYRDPKSIMTLSTEPPRVRYRDNLVPNGNAAGGAAQCCVSFSFRCPFALLSPVSLCPALGLQKRSVGFSGWAPGSRTTWRTSVRSGTSSCERSCTAREGRGACPCGRWSAVWRSWTGACSWRIDNVVKTRKRFASLPSRAQLALAPVAPAS